MSVFAVHQKIILPVLRWHYWQGLPTEFPELRSVDPLLRRRLSPQGRAGLAVADRGAEHGVRPYLWSAEPKLA